MGLVLVTQSLGLGLASVLAAAAVDALRGHNAHVLVASLAFDNGAGGTFLHTLLAEGAQIGVDSIHSQVPPIIFSWRPTLYHIFSEMQF